MRLPRAARRAPVEWPHRGPACPDRRQGRRQQLCSTSSSGSGMAREFGPYGITVNPIAPGAIETHMSRDVMMTPPPPRPQSEFLGLGFYLRSVNAVGLTGASVVTTFRL